MSKKNSDIQIPQEREDSSHKTVKANPVFQPRPKGKPVGKDPTVNCVSTLPYQKEVRQSASENEALVNQECVVSKSELSSETKTPSEKRVKKIYRSEKVINDMKADAQLKAEVKVNVTFLDKEVLQNSRSLKEKQDKLPTVTKNNKLQQQQHQPQQQQQQPRENNIPQRHLSPENRRQTTSIDNDVPSSTTNDWTTKEQYNTAPQISNSFSPYHSSTSTLNIPKSRSIFDSFCPNLFLENPVISKNLPPPKSNRMSKKIQSSTNDQKQRPTATSVEASIESQNQAAEFVRNFQSKSIPDVDGKHQSKSTLRPGETTYTGNIEVLTSPTAKPTNRISGNILLTSSPSSSSSKSDSAFKKFNNSKETQPAVNTTTTTLNSGIREKEAKDDSENSEEVKHPHSIFEIRNKAKSKISPKSIKCFKQNSSNMTRRFLKKFDRNSKHDIQKNQKKKQLLLLKMRSPLKCRTTDFSSIAVINSSNNNNNNNNNNSSDISNNNIFNNGLKQKLESHKKSRTDFPDDANDDDYDNHDNDNDDNDFSHDNGDDEDDDDEDDSNVKEDDESVEWSQKHGDYDSDETDICDYDSQPEEHVKTRRLHRLESSKAVNEFQMKVGGDDEEEEEEKCDSRSELGSDGSYDTTDEDLKTRRLAVLSLLPTKMSHQPAQLPDKISNNSMHNGDDRDKSISINSLSLTDSILKLGGKRVNEDVLSEMECAKKRQKKNQKMEPSELNDVSKKKHWLRHRNKVYFESELNELKTCKKLSLIEAKAKGLLTQVKGRQCNDELNSNSNNSPRLHNKGEIVNDEIPPKEKFQKKQPKQKRKQKQNSSQQDQVEESNSRNEYFESKLPSDRKDLAEDEKSCEWLIVEETRKDGEADAGEVRCDNNSNQVKVKKLKRHSKPEKVSHSNGNEQKTDKNESGKVGRKKKKVNEDGAEELKESFALSRELGPKFNWLEHKIQRNYKSDPNTPDVDVPSTPKLMAGIEPGVNALSSVSMTEGQSDKRSKMNENDNQKHEKRTKTSSSDQCENHLDESLPPAKHAFVRNLSKCQQQNDLTPAFQKEGKGSTKSTKRDSGSDNVQNLTDKPEIGVTNGIYSADSSTSNPSISTTTTQKASEPFNLIDLTSDNPPDQMNVRPSFTKSFLKERFYSPYYQNHLNELAFEQNDPMLRKVAEGQTRFRTMSPSFEFSDPILLHEYKQKFETYARLKHISEAKQREVIKLDSEKEKLKRELIVLLNVQNKLSACQPTHGQPKVGKLPIPIPSPPTVHASKILGKSGLTSPTPPFMPVVGMNSFPSDDLNMRLDFLPKFGGRRFFPPDLQVPHERLPRDGRMDYLPQSSSVRADESIHSHLEADHLSGGIPPRKSVPVALDDIGHEFSSANQTEQSFNDDLLNGLKMTSNRCADVTYNKDLAMAKPLTSQTLKMCYSVHKEFLEQWAGQKLTPSYKNPQILLQTLPTSDKLHLNDKQTRPSSSTGISSSSPDVIITNASIKTSKANQGMKYFDPTKESERNLLQEILSHNQKQTQPLTNTPPITKDKPKRLSSQEFKESSTGLVKDDHSSKLALDLTMKPSPNVSQGQAKEDEVQWQSSDILGLAEVNHGTHALDLSTPLNLKMHYHRDDHDFSEDQSSLADRHEQYVGSSKSQSSLDELHIHNKPSIHSSSLLQQLSKAEIQAISGPMVAPDASSSFPEWTDDKKHEAKLDINSVTVEEVESKSVLKEIDSKSVLKEIDSESLLKEIDKESVLKETDGESVLKEMDSESVLKEVENKSVLKFDNAEQYDTSDKKFESFSDASLPLIEEIDVKQSEEEDEKDDIPKHSEEILEKTVPISSAENIENSMTDETNDKKYPLVLRLSSERPNSCGELMLLPKMEASFSPMIEEIRSRSANIPLVALNFSKVSVEKDENEMSPNSPDNSSFRQVADLSTKKDFPLKQSLEIATDSAEKLDDAQPKPLDLKGSETYYEEPPLLNLSMKPKPVSPSLATSPLLPSTLERPSSKIAADEQTQAYLSDKYEARASAKAAPINDDEFISKSSMMMMMMMMSQTTKPIEGKPELLNLDSEKFNAHLDDTIKKELQYADKEARVSDSIDLSSPKLTSKIMEGGHSSKTSNSQQGRCSPEMRKSSSMEEAGLLRSKALTKSSSPLPQASPWEERTSSYPLRHSTDILQKEHSGRSQPSPAQYYRHHQPSMQQTALGIPPPIPQSPPTHHSSVQQQQQQQRQHQQFQHPKQQSQQKMLHLQHQQQPQVQQMLMRQQQQLEQLQRTRRSSSPVRTRHISSPTVHKHSKPYSRPEIDHMNMTDLKIGNTLPNGMEKFVLVDQALRKSVPQLDGHSKRQHPGDIASDVSQLSYYTQLQQQSRPQNMQLNYQQMQQHFQPPIRPYSPPPLRPPNPQRLHDLQLQQLELRRLHHQKGLKYPIPVHPQSSQLVHQLSVPGQDLHDPQAYAKPLVPQAQASTYQQSPSRYKNQPTNYPHEVRGFQNLPGVPPKDGLSPPAGFTNIPIKRRQESMDQQQYHAKHPMVPKHIAEASKHDHLILKSYQNEAESFWYYKQSAGRFDPSLVHGSRYLGHPKPPNEPTASRVYDHNFRSGLASEIDLRSIPMRGGPPSSPHIPNMGVGSSRDAIGMPNNLVEEHICFNCFKPAHFICSTCKKVSYCCKDCQAESWEKGHKDECR